MSSWDLNLNEFVTHAELLDKCFYFVYYSQKDERGYKYNAGKRYKFPPQVVLVFLFIFFYFLFLKLKQVCFSFKQTSN